MSSRTKWRARLYRAARRITRSYFSEIRLRGIFDDWNSAASKTAGYDSRYLLEKVFASANAAKFMPDQFERDGELVSRNARAWPLLCGILWAAASFPEKLKVLDFGGSLGSTYFHNQDFLKDFLEEWVVVEQEEFVRSGKACFENDTLTFRSSVEQSIRRHSPNLVLASSVLQYLAKPYDYLQKFALSSTRALVVDRTPFHEGPTDLITAQFSRSEATVSYPSWIFSRKKFLDFLGPDFTVISTLPSTEPSLSIGGRIVTYEGFVMTRRIL